MHRLIYVSRSLIAGRPDAVAEIVARSAVRNATAGVTGMLWHDGGHFIQALEGDVDAVAATFGRIIDDPRHTAIDIVANRAIARPMFGAWSMIQADESKVGTESAVFLYGLAHEEDTPGKRRMREVFREAFER